MRGVCLLVVLCGAALARHPESFLGINYILPAVIQHKRMDLEQAEPLILEAECDGERFAGFGVDQHALLDFVKHSNSSCSPHVTTRKSDFSAETSKYLHSLWKANRLLTHPTSPGVSAHASMESQMVSTSKALQRVFETADRDGDKHKTMHAIKTALGEDVLSLKHPSREAAQEVLTRMKKNFNFFHGDKCLVKSFEGKACGEEAHSIGAGGCNEDENAHMCSYTEVYKCPQCGATFRFPRYRSVPKILETKLGRCGEFSDVAYTVFDLLGYDTKQVVDYTDHVWVELDLNGRGHEEFTHADPSEGILDQPFLYEDNWKKQLTFVFAHTPDFVEDRSTVYWHPEKHAEVVSRRGMSDKDLEAVVFQANVDLEHIAPRQPAGHSSTVGENKSVKEERDLERVAAVNWRDLEEGMGSFAMSQPKRHLMTLINKLELTISELE